MGQSDVERNRRYRAKKREARLLAGDVIKRGRPPKGDTAIWHKTRARSAPFVGVDGEGGGRNRRGQQHYRLLRIGDRELYTGRPLSTVQCLDFMCQAMEPGKLHVAFGFEYDATMILRDIGEDRARRLYSENDRPVARGPRYVYYRDFAIAAQPGHYFSVARLQPNPDPEKPPLGIVPGSTRTVYETMRFFQRNFVTALEMFDVGTPGERAAIKAEKKRRSTFRQMTRRIRQYNADECRLLALLMEKFRAMAIAAPNGIDDSGIVPATWNGPGKMAAALFKIWRVPRLYSQTSESQRDRASELDFKILNPPNGLIPAAQEAYYGGRFENPAVGRLPKGYVNDINSAYPAAMAGKIGPGLPCLIHGRWHRFKGDPPDDGLYLAKIEYAHHDTTAKPAHLCGLPHRDRHGRLSWRVSGGGTYWSVEMTSAKLLGLKVLASHGGWAYEKRCDCKPFPLIEGLYNRRLELGKTAAGHTLKLVINSLYGKTAQRIGGGGPFTNHIYAGLVTAIVRAELNKVIALDPKSVVMLATDSVVTLRPLPIDIGKGLGQWSVEETDGDMFVVQPGFGWWIKGGKSVIKTRGVPERFINGPVRRRFMKAWASYLDVLLASLARGKGRQRPPTVKVKVETFIGWRLALQLKRLPGVWLQRKTAIWRDMNFEWIGKRQGAFATWAPPRSTPGYVITAPIWGTTYEGLPQILVPPELQNEEQRRVQEAARRERTANGAEWSRSYTTGEPLTNLLEDSEILWEGLPDFLDNN